MYKHEYLHTRLTGHAYLSDARFCPYYTSKISPIFLWPVVALRCDGVADAGEEPLLIRSAQGHAAHFLEGLRAGTLGWKDIKMMEWNEHLSSL